MPAHRGLGSFIAVMLGAAALIGSVVAVVVGFVVVITAPEGGGVDFRLLYCVVAVAALVPLGVIALQVARHQER